ncbi:non-ribosomal peptide synthetase [Paenibacillus sp. UMB4589-SE434]|uniref:non-ribosomal peptide synthetase n=1 Tax=Paenibacillus sp. UMB4589-SE434 TaxID=3046314 RepID=UPI00254ADC84|nr:non-ribosomal peptide synthetase [Paenibacillus sp. UMB4589-SE434]MDK8182713.1 amino acid adenylation domain-containing protein [Paenibacillus sp. UMB4589-SE434]
MKKNTNVEANLSRLEKEEMIRQLLQQRAERRDSMVSVGERALWLQQHVNPDSCAYHMQAAWDLLSPIDEQKLHDTSQRLYDTYSSLRTTFVLHNGEIKRQVQPAGSKVDYEAYRLNTWDEEAEALFRSHLRQPFSLQAGPLFRVKLYILSDGPPRLLLSLHHIITDAWSVVMLLQAFVYMYDQEIPTPIKKTAEQHYGSFVEWQNQYLKSARAEQDGGYWHRTLAGELPVCSLVTDRAGGAANDAKGGSHSFRLSDPLTQAVIRLCRELGVTLNTLLLASFAALLQRYTDQEEIVVGTFSSGRSEAAFERIFGYLVNPVAVRLSCPGELAFDSLVAAAKQKVLEAMKHGDYPFPLLVERLSPDRDAKVSPIFQVAFVMERAQRGNGEHLPSFISNDKAQAEWGSFTLQSVPLEAADAQYELVLMMEETDTTIQGSLIYRASLFTADFVENMAVLYTKLLEEVVNHPEEQIGRIRLETAAADQQSLLQNAQAEIPPICLHHLLEYQAVHRPHAVAVTSERGTLCYAQVNERANQIAQMLFHKGVRKGDFVGICLQRSLDMVVSVFAVLKLGAAFVPIDPAYPLHRKKYMAERVNMSALISVSTVELEMINEKTELVLLDVAESDPSCDPASFSSEQATVYDVAYVIFTSGSTGQPKAVLVEHRGIWNMAQAQRQYFDLSEASNILQFASFSFDAWVFELVMAFRSGGALCMTEMETLLSGTELVRWLAEQRISHAVLPPSVLSLIPDAALPDLKVIISAGEACTPEIVARWAPGRKFFNAYGPSEATVWATVKECTPDDPVLDLGHAIPNVQVYVFNSCMQRPLPGGIGELYIGGVGLARGYYDDPDMTSSKFIAVQGTGHHGAERLYKTGDLVRCGLDGSLQFVGRQDDQVKVRGVRLHLGEVEAQLITYEGIAQSVVMMAGSPPEQARLVAFIVMKPETAWNELEVKRFLQDRLPSPYIPSRFVVVQQVPLTPNGKMDRKSLLALLEHHQEEMSEVIENSHAMSMTEQVLIQVWQRLLDKKGVTLDAHFFESGGHSLLATQLISKIQEVFGVELPIRTVFTKPVLRDMAGEIMLLQQHTNYTPRRNEIVPLQQSANFTVPLTSAQQRMWFLQKLDETQNAYLLPGVMTLKGHLHVEALTMSLQKLIHRHESFRTSIQMAAGSPVAVVHSAPAFQLEVKQCSEEEAKLWIQQECQRPILLSEPALYRITLLRTGEQQHQLVMVLHHIITDGWSMGIMMNELCQLYSDFVGHTTTNLPPLPLTYSDYAHWEQGWIGSESYHSQLKYWMKLLQTPIPPLQLPSDYSRTLVQSYGGKRVCLQLPLLLSEQLKSLGQQHSCTLFMTLFAAFNLLLHRLSGTADIAVGVPIAGRNHPHLEQVTGLFVNTLLLRTNLSEPLTYTELLLQIRESALGAYAHPDIPIEKLVEMARPDRDLSRSSMFQVMFNMLNIPPVAAQLEGLAVQIMEWDEHDSKCDLTLYAQEQAEGIQLELVYATGLFSQERALELLSQFQSLCSQIVKQPNAPLRSYSLLTEHAAKVLPDPSLPLRHPDDHLLQPIQVMFQEQAAQYPEAAAVVDWENTVYTYRQLDRSSDELAAEFIRFGTVERGVIAIYGERSAFLIIAMLAVLKSGSAFVVIDPAQPSARVAEMVKVSGARGIVLPRSVRQTRPTLFEELSGLVSFVVREHEYKRFSDAEQTAVLLRRKEHTLHDPAYMLFTSGTTAAPKGISCTHEPIASFIRWYVNEFELQAQDRFSMFSGLGHDPLLRDIFVPLSIGATICIPDSSNLLDKDYLNGWMVEQQITVTHLTPAMAMVMAGGSKRGKVISDWRYAFLGGDTLLPSQVEHIRTIAPHVRCYNCYGATETPQIMGIYAITDSLGPNIPIGKGREGVQLLIADSDLLISGIGETGEICIRSPYLASGYVQSEVDRSSPFIADPNGSTAHDRIYRTGDLGRYRPDGNIEFIGRQGDRVKIRGYRIQLREIQQVVMQHPSVHDCCIICQAHAGDRIVAYVVSADKPLEPAALQLYLRDKLPEYMLPAAVVEVPHIPLTHNGKIAIEQLPEPDMFIDRGCTSEMVPPATPLQQTIAEVWRHHLHIKEIGIHDNFFEAGGHSLLLLRVQQHLEEVLMREIQVVDLFKYPTISLLACYLEGRDTTANRRHDRDEASQHRASKQRAAQQAQKSRRKGVRQ